MLKLMARLMALGSVLIGWLNLTEITHPTQLTLVTLKVVAGSVAPVAAVLGGVAALIGMIRKDHMAALAGLIGGSLAVRHIARVTAAHAAFESAFGDAWRARLPPHLRPRMLPRRYTLTFPEPPEVICLRDQVIGTTPKTGQSLLCDLWKPPMWIEPTGLGIIYLHGSGWHYADKDFSTRLFFRHLAAQGHLILDLSYPLAPEADLPCMLGAVRQAVIWLKTHSAAHGVRPDRVALMGASAGAHLALLAAYAQDEANLPSAAASVRAVVAYYGPADVEFYYRYTHEHFGDAWSGRTPLSRLSAGFISGCLHLYERGTQTQSRLRLTEVGLLGPAEMLSHFLGGTPDEIPDVYRLASPLSHVGPHCPPTLLLNGAHDVAIKPEMTRRLHQALREAGVQAVYVEFADTEHGLDLIAPRISPAFHAATYDIERFLALMV